MAVYYKPQSPIQSGEDFIYPITTADQIMKSDNSRRLEQAGLIVADNSTSLGGVAASGYALKTDTAPDSNKLGGVAAIDYALKTDTAPDSSKLGGKTPEYYLQPRNLLDNSDFRNPVNQRGQTSYTSSEYTIDRWYISGGSCTIENGNGVIVSSLDDPKMTFMQFLENIDVEKVYTFAIKDIDGNVYLIRSTPGERIEEDTSFGTIIAKTLPGDITFAITISAANSKKFIWAALYEGSYTADTLPPYVPKGYAAELAECQRYYLPVQDFWSMGIILTGTGYICLNIPTNIKMRITPSAIISGAKAYHPTYGWFDLTYGSIEWYPPFYRIRFTWPDNIQSSLSDLVLINGVSGLSADL